MKENYEVIIKNLHKFYGETKVFYGLNMKFVKNKVTVVLGASGCGKTTLLNIISGIDKDYKGDILVNTSSISYVFQEDRLIKNLNVYDNIAFVLKSKMKRENIDNIISKYLKIVHLENCKDKFPDELSGGMKRRVAFTRACVYNADLVLMDEPFKGLDSNLKNEIMDQFLKIHQISNNTAIIVTHDKAESKKLGDIIYSLD